MRLGGAMIGHGSTDVWACGAMARCGWVRSAATHGARAWSQSSGRPYAPAAWGQCDAAPRRTPACVRPGGASVGLGSYRGGPAFAGVSGHGGNGESR